MNSQESLENECSTLRTRVKVLECALREIVNYNSFTDPDKDLMDKYYALVKESSDCTACQYAKNVKWPQSGFCDEHHKVITNLVDEIAQMYNDKQKFKPIEIARKALGVVE